MSWKDLDIKLKAELIKLGVLSGIRDIKLIRLLYDDINIPTLVGDLSYNETNVRPLLGIERIKLEYGIPEEEVNKANEIIQLIENEISLEEINNQLPVLFRLFKNGGPIEDKRIKKYNNNSAGYLYDSFVTDNLERGENPHNFRRYTISEELAEKLGYYRDEISGHRDDAVKLPDHPSHSSRGTFKDIDGYHIFDLTDRGANDVNYTISGLIDNGDDHVIPIYKGSYMLPEVTITPNGNYVHDTYNNLKWHSNNPTLALVGKVKKYNKGGYENTDEPPVSESTGVAQRPLSLEELQFIKMQLLLGRVPTQAELILDERSRQANLYSDAVNTGVVSEAKEDNIKNNFFRGYNNFRYSYPWAEALSYTPIIGDGMDLISLAGAVNNKDYMTAGLGLGMLALPNFIEKPIKKSSIKNLNILTDDALELAQENFIRQMYSDELLGKGWANSIALNNNQRYLQPFQIDFIDNHILKRMRQNNFQKDSDIKRIKKRLSISPYYEYPTEYFLKAGYPDTGGWYLPWDGRIIMNASVPAIKVLPHEYRHLIDLYFPLNSYNKIYLNRAYKDYFKNLGLTLKDGFEDGLSDEMVTTNLDARIQLFKGKRINYDGYEMGISYTPLNILNQFILEASTEEILNALELSNAYGQKFVQFLKNKGDKYIEEKIPHIKNALRNVPAVIPFGLMSYKLFNQNNQEEYKNGGFLFPNLAFSHKFDDGGNLNNAVLPPIEITAESLYKPLEPREAPLFDNKVIYLQAPRRSVSPTILEYWSEQYNLRIKEEEELKRLKEEFIERLERQKKAEKAHERYTNYLNSAIGRGLSAAQLGLSVVGLHPALKIPAETVNTIISIPEAALALNDMKYNGVSTANALSTISAIPLGRYVDNLGNNWVNKALAKKFGTSTWDSKLLRSADTYFPVRDASGNIVPSTLQSSFKAPEYMLNVVPNMVYDAGSIIIDATQLK